MKVKTIPSSWITREGRRLDCGPYMSGALEAKILLERLPVSKAKLQDLTEGGAEGIINAGRIRRIWVTDPNYGVPFLSSSDILQADLSTLPLISKRVIAENPKLLIKKGWTLITRSGTIGRMTYARADMEGMGCSEHVMRVVPDNDKIPSGYLYAYLSSKFGVPQIVSGTYGSIIQSIEPHHIANLPVPRLDAAVEQRVHALVEEAAQLRTFAGQKRQQVIDKVTLFLGWQPRSLVHLSTVATAHSLQRRMDAFHHTKPVRLARESLAAAEGSLPLGSVVHEVFEPNRGARIKVENTDFGVPFLSSSEVFRLDPCGEYLISRKRTSNLERLLIQEQDLLLPRSGQLGGIIGRAVLPLPTYYDHAATEHLVRIRCRTKEDAYYLWAIFASEPGYFAAIGTAFGSSIPSLDCDLLSELKIPWGYEEIYKDLVGLVSEKVAALTNAICAEREAIRLVEQAIEEAT